MKTTILPVDQHKLVPLRYRVMGIALFSHIILIVLWFILLIRYYSHYMWIPLPIILITALIIDNMRKDCKKTIDSEFRARAKALIRKRSIEAQSNGMHLSREVAGLEVVDTLLIDDTAKQVRLYKLKNDSKIPRTPVKEIIFDYNEIKRVSIHSEPTNLVPSVTDRMVLKAMSGSVERALYELLVNNVVESVTNGSQEYIQMKFYLLIRFKISFRKRLKFEPIRSNFGMNKDNIYEYRTFARKVIDESQRYEGIMLGCFGDKMK